MHATLLLLSLLAQAAPVNARVSRGVVNDDVSSVTFESSDYATNVTKYSLLIYRRGETTPLVTADLGKPDLADPTHIIVNFTSLVAPFAVAGEVYEARVVAIGPGGASQPSALSNQFRFSACSAGFAPTQVTAPAAGQTYTVTLNIGPGCDWTTAQDVPWLRAEPYKGTGPAVLTVTADPSNTSLPRSGTLQIGGWRFSATQDGMPCAVRADVTSLAFPAGGSTQNLPVFSAAGCVWAPTTANTWVSLGNGGGWTGNGQLIVTVAPNPVTVGRASSINVGGLSIPVTQAALTCDAALTMTSMTSVRVNGAQLYTWSGSTDPRGLQTDSGTKLSAAWYNTDFSFDVTVPTGLSQAISFYMADYDNSGRVQQIDIMDGTTVLDTRTISGFTGGRYVTWNLSGHVTVRVRSTSGPNAVISGYFLGATSPNARAAFVTTDDATGGAWKGVYGGAGYQLATEASHQAVLASGGQQTVAVAVPAGCAWTATSDVPWMTVVGNGTGPGTATLMFAQNTGAARSATLTVGNVTLNIVQGGVQ